MTISGPRFQPPDASVAPRYTGPRTFARLPHVELPHEDVDAAVIGVPFDTATSFRTGARFGPEAIRSASAMLRPYHPRARRRRVRHAVGGRRRRPARSRPGNAQRTAEQIAAGLEPVLRAGIVPVVLGGDHSIVLGELRAHAAVHGPVGLVLLDAHADTWDQYYGERYFHGTPFRRAVEEGLLDPSRSLLAGMRGPLYGPADVDQPREMGFEVIDGDELRTLARRRGTASACARGSATGRSSCRSTSTCSTRPSRPERGRPRWRGCRPREALGFLRALAGIPFTGFDLVEVSPAYDAPRTDHRAARRRHRLRDAGAACRRAPLIPDRARGRDRLAVRHPRRRSSS